jgi:hypothetical protein
VKRFTCQCGQNLYFDNSRCLACGNSVGFDPELGDIVNLDPAKQRQCQNGTDYNVCNWLVPQQENKTLCASCRITHITPDLSHEQNIRRWRILEIAKRRLLYNLMQFNLSIAEDAAHGQPALSFQFLEDQGSNPLVAETFVRTGHASGVITINVTEADDVLREANRLMMNEAYRTPLGHCRHESGHYYYDRLIRGTDLEGAFRALFGDPDIDYEQALQDYYANPPSHRPDDGYISNYAQSHPLEDWAECWAHYLHINDTLETAASWGVMTLKGDHVDADQWLREWLELSVILNEMNRSMGLADAYPFTLTGAINAKLRFINSVVGR